MTLTHLDSEGRTRMVDVGSKSISSRRAVAEGRVTMSAIAAEQIRTAGVKKGDVLGVAEVAGVMAAKKTGEMIPLCHPLVLDQIEVRVTVATEWSGVRVVAVVSATGRTGVEMEALTAVSAACLTVYDMVKSVDRGMSIGPIRLLEKTGGARGPWRAADSPEQEVER